ncbi:MAG: arginine N-succinyltransferase [Deltaproteobacteria bacterium]|nr:arginine N-succinyltransferase [Deltaproteobacteria bacterium]
MSAYKVHTIKGGGPVFLLRNATLDDHQDLCSLAAFFDTVNLPHDEKVIHELLEGSVRAFSGKETAPLKREYLFVLEDGDRKVVGTSQVLAQHGTKEKPHIYFDVFDEERYSSSVDRYFRHKVLRIGFNYDGPSEIGGLVLHPSLRGRPGKLGKQLSFVRFLYIAQHRDAFRNKILAELLPPLEDDGHSLLWEALGRRFTGMSYAEADKSSKENKEFIQNLFPSGTIYTSLLDEKAQAVIGEVGKATVGVQRMLGAIGFRAVPRIDPFDGGPHFEAKTSLITPVRDAQRSVAKSCDVKTIRNAAGESAEGLVAFENAETGDFRAVWADFRYRDGFKIIEVPSESLERLGAVEGSPVASLPFARHSRI